MILGPLLGLILGFADYATEGLFRKTNEAKMKFISFAAGISVSYVFLILLPEIYTGASAISPLLFFPVLIGFALFHLLEKFIRQHHSWHHYKKEHELVHEILSFLYFFVVGFVIAKLAKYGMEGALLLFVPLFFHIIIDSLPKKVTKHQLLRAFFASSPFLGSIAGSFVETSRAVNVSLLGIVGGALLYIIVRESLPKERDGKPMYFLVGLLSFTVLILFLWNGFN
tara:strand:+ start:134 stop:811 length:678 start_codon:yes stop_codon:yes gene_type:complete